MTTQLMFGLMSGVEKVAPYAEGDILVRKRGDRVVVKGVVRDAESVEPEVLLCVSLASGNDCVVFPREVLYRSK